jgi:hypothetical protein
MKRVVIVLAICAAASAAQAGLARYLAQHDVVAALLVERDPSAGALVAVVIALRLFLILLAPGWLLWLVVSRAERRFRKSAAQSSSTVPDKMA